MNGAEVAAAFRKRFGSEPEIIAVAPGRTNLIGEHTDYNDGFAFPAAIDRGLWIAASGCAGPSELVSIELGEGEPFDAPSIGPPNGKSWSKYAAGMAWALRPHREVGNIRAVVGSDLPIASGVSSSAAIEMAFGVTWIALGNLGISNKELALLGQRCENGFIGLQSGIMDQMASAMGRRGCAMLLDTRSMEIEYVGIPDHLVIALCDTGKSRELAASAYNERRAQCEEACRALGIPKLRDASIELLNQGKGRLEETVYRRARHVITENLRCLAFVDALRLGDEGKMGRLMQESHASLRDDYEVSCSELDAMAEIARGANGCVGARLTGAGFGGACVALVNRDLGSEFKSIVELNYASRVGLIGEVAICEAADGARVAS